MSNGSLILDPERLEMYEIALRRGGKEQFDILVKIIKEKPEDIYYIGKLLSDESDLVKQRAASFFAYAAHFLPNNIFSAIAVDLVNALTNLQTSTDILDTLKTCVERGVDVFKASEHIMKLLFDRNPDIRWNAAAFLRLADEKTHKTISPLLLDVLVKETTSKSISAKNALENIIRFSKSLDCLFYIKTLILEYIANNDKSMLYQDRFGWPGRAFISLLADINRRKNEIFASQLDIRLDGLPKRPFDKKDNGIYRMRVVSR